jgi:NADP-dependent 3-hydroxy acid dehydrogenase YdfG
MNEQPAIFGDRHAVVSGASRGIGRAIAAALAAEGARVSLLGRDEGRLSQVSRELGETSRANPVTVDVADAVSVNDAFATVRKHFGPVHILINSAGQAASAKFADTDPTLWNAILGVQSIVIAGGEVV